MVGVVLGGGGGRHPGKFGGVGGEGGEVFAVKLG